MDVDELRAGKHLPQQRDAGGVDRVLDQQRVGLGLEHRELVQQVHEAVLPPFEVAIGNAFEKQPLVHRTLQLTRKVEPVVERQRVHVRDRRLVLLRRVGTHRDRIDPPLVRQHALEQRPQRPAEAQASHGSPVVIGET